MIFWYENGSRYLHYLLSDLILSVLEIIKLQANEKIQGRFPKLGNLKNWLLLSLNFSRKSLWISPVPLK